VSQASLFTDEWFARLSEALATVIPEKDWPRLDLGIVINDAPGRPISYTFHIGPEGAGLQVGSVESAAVIVVESFETACSIDKGASVSELLAEGRITVRGDASALVAAQRPLATISAILGDLADSARS
jgi:hypothetical protein